MDIFRILLSIILGFLLSGIWYGLLFLYSKITHKLDIKWLIHIGPIFASIIPLIIIKILMGLYPVRIEGIKNIYVYFAAILTVVITVIITSGKSRMTEKNGWDLLIYGLNGALMEIAQRLMMQSFIYGVLKLSGVLNAEFYSIIATALVWCMGIGMQAILARKIKDKDLLIDITASFTFSLGIGYVYQQTGLIYISMAAHFLERILSAYIMGKKKSAAI